MPSSTASRNSTSTRHSRADEERLLDDAVADTFPASDPPAPVYPGSVAANKAEATVRARAATQRALAFTATGVLVAVGLMVMRRGRRKAASGARARSVENA